MLRLIFGLVLYVVEELWASETTDPAMPSEDGFARPIETIDGQLADIARLNHAARSELIACRCRITENQAQELNLIAAVDAQMRRADRLLDERNHAATAEQLVSQ